MAKELYEDNLVFADTMNVLFFDGKPMIRAQDLSPLNPTHDMLDLEGVPDILRERIPNYQITLLQPENVTNQQLARMKSPLRHILGVIKASTNWQDMNNYVNQNKKDLSHLDSLTAGIISEACNMNIPKHELEKEDVNMCEALVQLKEIGRQEGLSEGEVKGKIVAYLECGKSDDWIIDHLQITQEKLDEIRDNQ